MSRSALYIYMLNFYSACSLNQQLAGRHITVLDILY